MKNLLLTLLFALLGLNGRGQIVTKDSLQWTEKSARFRDVISINDTLITVRDVNSDKNTGSCIDVMITAQGKLKRMFECFESADGKFGRVDGLLYDKKGVIVASKNGVKKLKLATGMPVEWSLDLKLQQPFYDEASLFKEIMRLNDSIVILHYQRVYLKTLQTTSIIVGVSLHSGEKLFERDGGSYENSMAVYQKDKIIGSFFESGESVAIQLAISNDTAFVLSATRKLPFWLFDFENLKILAIDLSQNRTLWQKNLEILPHNNGGIVLSPQMVVSSSLISISFGNGKVKILNKKDASEFLDYEGPMGYLEYCTISAGEGLVVYCNAFIKPNSEDSTKSLCALPSEIGLHVCTKNKSQRSRIIPTSLSISALRTVVINDSTIVLCTDEFKSGQYSVSRIRLLKVEDK